MKKMLMYNECDETYTEVVDVQELKQYIQDLIIKIKDIIKNIIQIYIIQSVYL